jgi:hypothetical protein
VIPEVAGCERAPALCVRIRTRPSRRDRNDDLNVIELECRCQLRDVYTLRLCVVAIRGCCRSSDAAQIDRNHSRGMVSLYEDQFSRKP